MEASAMEPETEAETEEHTGEKDGVPWQIYVGAAALLLLAAGVISAAALKLQKYNERR